MWILFHSLEACFFLVSVNQQRKVGKRKTLSELFVVLVFTNTRSRVKGKIGRNPNVLDELEDKEDIVPRKRKVAKVK